MKMQLKNIASLNFLASYPAIQYSNKSRGFLGTVQIEKPSR